MGLVAVIYCCRNKYVVAFSLNGSNRELYLIKTSVDIKYMFVVELGV